MERRNTIVEYYNLIFNKKVIFQNLIMIFKYITFKNVKEDSQLVIENKYLRKILHVMGYKVISEDYAFERSKHFFLMYQVLESLIIKDIPCYYFARPNTLEKRNYSELAQIRIENKLDFPKISEKYHDFEDHFKEILGEKSSKKYVEGLKKIPQVIRRGNLFGHKDISSKYVNISNGRRIVFNSPENEDKVIHIYGRCGAFGYAVEDQYCIPNLIQKGLNKKLDNKIKVINHGLWGSSDEYILNNLVVNSSKYSDDDIVVLYQKQPIDEELVYFKKLGMHFFDCTEELHNRLGQFNFYDRVGHLNAEGYEIVSNYIIDMIESTGYSCSNVSEEKYISKYDYIRDYQENSSLGEFHKKLIQYLNDINKEYPDNGYDKKIGAIVMNCNPFTYGHRYLIEYAAGMVDRLYVFVLQEDKSFFKFDDRIELVKKGTSDLSNVIVLPSGEFMISAMTFPEYFMKDYKKSTDFDATNDLSIFGEYIAKKLNISIRFAGEEPIDVVTKEYNRNMKKLLPDMGVEFHEIKRKTVDGQQVISASRVRSLMKDNMWEEIKLYVPKTTYDFLINKYNK